MKISCFFKLLVNYNVRLINLNPKIHGLFTLNRSNNAIMAFYLQCGGSWVCAIERRKKGQI